MSKTKICVIGLGYIGLPTASIFASNGFEVRGVDVNQSIVETINQGNIHIEEPGLETVVKAAVSAGKLTADLNPCEAEVFILAVPTPITHDKKADLSYVQAAARSIIPYLRRGNLVILESTSPPRTTLDVLVPILEESGLVAGEDLLVAHSPERVLPGKILKELIENSRVIGGINQASSIKAQELYSSVVKGEILLTDATTAEMVKLMENTYRDVNIALANELAIISGKLGINAWDVVDLANHHPRVNIHQPGPGVGGHCISVDPWFLVEALPNDARIIRTARQINDDMPYRTAALVRETLGNTAKPKVTILGVTYKGNVDDTRESPAIEVISHLKLSGIEVSIYDPHVSHFKFELSNLIEAFRDSDCAILLADHNEYKHINPVEISDLMRSKVVIDSRKTLDLELWKNAGFQTILLGKTRLPEISIEQSVPKNEIDYNLTHNTKEIDNSFHV